MQLDLTAQLCFPLEEDQSKRSSGCAAWRKALRSQARNLYASAEVATFLLNEFQAESLLILDVGSEWHRGITEEAAEQKTEMIRHSRETDERLRRGYSQDGDPTCISVSCSYAQAWQAAYTAAYGNKVICQWNLSCSFLSALQSPAIREAVLSLLSHCELMCLHHGS